MPKKLLKLKYPVSHRLFQDGVCVHPEFLCRFQGSEITWLLLATHASSFHADLTLMIASRLGSVCPGCPGSRGIAPTRCFLLEETSSKVSKYTSGPLTALLVLLSLGTARSLGAEAPYSLQARLSLSNVLRGYEKVGCQKRPWGIANPLPESPHAGEDTFEQVISPLPCGFTAPLPPGESAGRPPVAGDRQQHPATAVSCVCHVEGPNNKKGGANLIR